MGGEGSMQGANDSLKLNRGQLGRRPNMFRREHSYFKIKREYKKHTKGIKSFNELSDSEKKIIRAKIKKKAKREKIFVITASILFIITFCFGMFNFNKYSKTLHTIETKKNAIKETEKQYLKLLMYGDTWIEDEKWNPAISQYKEAILLYPNSYDAQYRLAIAYSYKCERMKYDCDLGTILITKLLHEYPDKNKQLLKLDSIFKVNTTEPMILIR